MFFKVQLQVLYTQFLRNVFKGGFTNLICINECHQNIRTPYFSNPDAGEYLSLWNMSAGNLKCIRQVAGTFKIKMN